MGKRIRVGRFGHHSIAAAQIGQGLDAEVQILDTEGKTIEILKMDNARTGELQAA